MVLGRSCSMRFGRERGNVGQGREKVVGLLEEADFRIALSPGSGEEDACLAAGAEGDVGGKARAAAGFLEDRRGGGGVA